MNINKEHSPAWVKITIWITIFAFVFAFIAVGFLQVITSIKSNSSSSSSSTSSSSTTTSAAQQISTVNSQYQTSAVSSEALVKKEPKNKTQVASLAGLYSQWGTALLQISNSTEAQTQAAEKLQTANKYWKQAYDLDPNDKEVAGDYATSLYYVDNTQGAIKVAQEVVKKNPKYATVWYYLGIYQSATNKSEAIKSLENAIKYETDATQKKSAQEALASLKKSSN